MLPRQGHGALMQAPRMLQPSRRPYVCSECHKTFKTRYDLLWHAEGCLIEAFENEALSSFSDANIIRSHKFSQQVAMKQVSTPGITVKSLDEQPRQQWIKLKIGSNQQGPSCKIDDQMLQEQEELLEYDNQDFSENMLSPPPPQTLEGPGGIRMMVTVEKDEIGDQPPILDIEDREVDGMSEDQRNLEELEEDEDYVGTSASFAMRHNPHNQVIGALANATDDPYKPKMECPTCGLILYRHNFATHHRIHTGELPFPCNFCPKRFRTTSSLKVHIRAHTGEKPYACQLCSYATITKRNLDRHHFHHHTKPNSLKGPVSRKSRYRDQDDQDDAEWVEMADTQHYDKEDHRYLEHMMEEAQTEIELETQKGQLNVEEVEELIEESDR